MRRITPASDERRISGSVNFGRAGEVVLVVEADADAVGDAPAAAGALVRRRLADRLDRQLLDLAAKAVALDARRAGVDDVADAGHGERGLGDVGGEHDAARAVRRRTRGPALPATGARTAAAPRRSRRMVLAQVLGRVADLALAGQEDEHVAGRRAARCQSSSTASQIASPRSWSRVSSNGRQRSSTGYSRPETWITGAGPSADAKCCAKRSASIVAEVTITFRSGRRGRIWRR